MTGAAGALAGRLKGLAGEAGSLKRRALSAGVWRLGGFGATQVLRLGSNLVLTRLLAPEDFGVAALIFTIHAGLVMMTDVGIRPSVVRSDHGETPAFLRTAWTIQLAQLASVAGLVLLAAAGLDAFQRAFGRGETVLADPRLPSLLAASAGIVLLMGLRSANLALMQRRLQVKPLIYIELLTHVVTIIVTIACAVVWRSVWAIVFGAAVGKAFFAILSHVRLPGPSMRLAWHTSHAAEIWRYGKWIAGASASGFVINQGDRLILSALLDARSFGLFAIAMVWIEAFRRIGQMPIQQIVQPSLNEVRRDRPWDLARVFFRLRRLTDLILLLAAGAVLVLAQAGLERLYDPRYHEAAPLIAILAVGMASLRYRVLGQVAQAFGDSRSLFFATAMSVPWVFLGVPAAFRAFGIEGAMLAVALIPLLPAPKLLLAARRHVPIDLRREWAVLVAVPVLGAAWAFLAVPRLF